MEAQDEWEDCFECLEILNECMLPVPKRNIKLESVHISLTACVAMLVFVIVDKFLKLSVSVLPYL